MKVGAIAFNDGFEEVVEGELALFDMDVGLRGVAIDVSVFDEAVGEFGHVADLRSGKNISRRLIVAGGLRSEQWNSWMEGMQFQRRTIVVRAGEMDVV
jgi:hypothetical protein